MAVKKSCLRVICIIDTLLLCLYILSNVFLKIDITSIAMRYICLWDKVLQSAFLSFLTAGILVFIEYRVEKKKAIENIYIDVFDFLFIVQILHEKAIHVESGMRSLQSQNEEERKKMIHKINFLLNQYKNIIDNRTYIKKLGIDFENLDFLNRHQQLMKKVYEKIYLPIKEWYDDLFTYYLDVYMQIDDPSDEAYERKLQVIGIFQKVFFEETEDGLCPVRYKKKIADIYDCIEELRLILPNSKPNDSEKNPFIDK